MKIIISCLLIFIASSVGAQYSFEDAAFLNRKIEIPEEFKEKDEVILYMNRMVELVPVPDNLEQYELIHEIRQVKSNEAIEKNNRIYIPFGQNTEIVKNINRVILPDGSEILLNEDDVHEETDTETGNSYKYYAVKGLVEGAIIEQLYIKRSYPKLTGSTFRFQFSAPVIESVFQLIYPKHLEFKYKSYNGLEEAELIEESEDFDKKKLVIKSNNLAAANFDEKTANPVIHVKSWKYMFWKNTVSGAMNFYGYSDFAKNVDSNINRALSKKDIKAIENLFDDVDKIKNDKAKVLEIESRIKQTIVYNSNYSYNENVKDILDAKQGNLTDMLILYKAAFKQLGIKTEMVFTTNRFKRYFDPFFETTGDLDEVLLYFPDLDQYLDPLDASLRSPLYNYNYGANRGLRIKEVEFGGAMMVVPEETKIELPGMMVSSDTMFINVDFTEEIDNPQVDSRIIFGGYSGANLQPIKDYVPTDQYEEIKKDISKNYAADVEMDKLEFINDGMDNLGKKNFEIQVSFGAEPLIQEAGDKYLFKIGELIGKQSEIYQAEERMFPVEMTYPHHYYRVLKVKIPEGYTIANAEDLNMDFVTEMEDEKQAIFKSDYVLKDNMLVITNEEYYRIVQLPVSVFKEYQAVINAAADFNKIVLVLQEE